MCFVYRNDSLVDPFIFNKRDDFKRALTTNGHLLILLFSYCCSLELSLLMRMYLSLWRSSKSEIFYSNSITIDKKIDTQQEVRENVPKRINWKSLYRLMITSSPTDISRPFHCIMMTIKLISNTSPHSAVISQPIGEKYSTLMRNPFIEWRRMVNEIKQLASNEKRFRRTRWVVSFL